MLDVSVTIVNWNTKEYLLSCLRSLLDPGIRSSHSVTVVDNASGDGSVQAVKVQFPDVRVIALQRNEGFAAACNAGLRKGDKAQYYCLLNADVEVMPDCLDALVEYMNSQPQAAIAAPRILGPDGKLRPSCYRFPNLWNYFCETVFLHRVFSVAWLSGPKMAYWEHDTLRSVDVVAGCLLLVRASAVSDVGYMAEDYFMYSEDFDWCRRFRRRGWTVDFVPNAVALHHGGRSSVQNKVQMAVALQRSNLRYWREYHCAFSVAAFVLLLIARHISRLCVACVLLPVRPSSAISLKAEMKSHLLSILYVLADLSRKHLRIRAFPPHKEV